MHRKTTLFILLLLSFPGMRAQTILEREDFGTAAAFTGTLDQYSDLSSDFAFRADSAQVNFYKNNPGPSSYPGASGNNQLILRSEDHADTIQFSFNTSGQEEVRFGFGIFTWGNPRNAARYYFSADGESWTEFDQDQADSPWEKGLWNYVKLSEVLPPVEQLQIRIVRNPAFGTTIMDDLTLHATIMEVTLSSLLPQQGVLLPDFDPLQPYYTVRVPSGTSAPPALDYSLYDPLSTVEIVRSAADFDQNDETILRVKASDGSASMDYYISYLRAPKQPNVLFIGIDDLRPELGSYDADYIFSPNIDALAAQGMQFDRAYVQQAVCSASRASLLSGCYPNTTTVDYPYNDYYTDEFLNTHTTLPRYFHDSLGYFSSGMGKIHHGGVYDLNKLSLPYYSGDPEKSWREAYGLPENNALALADSPDRPAVEAADVEDRVFTDGLVAEMAMDRLRRSALQEKPFFMAVGFSKPHLPFACPKKYWDLYDREAIDLTQVPDLPLNAPSYAGANLELPSYGGALGKNGALVTGDQARELIHGYYACVSFVDAQIGKVMKELERLGLDENTIIVLWSDHGYQLGDQRSWCKHSNYENSTRVPLIISYPGMEQKGMRSRSFVEYVDLYPTICELAGARTPAFVEGLSMVPLLEEPSREWKEAAFSQYPRSGGLEGFAIRTGDYRYVEWRNSDGTVDARELYDHRTDSIESVNIATAAPDVVEDLSIRLVEGWKGAYPTGIENPYANQELAVFLDIAAENARVSVSPEREVYEPGTEVTIGITPDEGYLFGGWSGDYSSQSETISIRLDSSVNLEALVYQPVYLNIAAEHATVTVEPDKDHYVPAEQVSVELYPDEGFEFVEWTGDISSTEVRISFAMDSSISITAVVQLIKGAGEEKSSGHSRLRIYPNPAQDLLVISRMNGILQGRLEIYDVAGRLWISRMAKEQEVFELDVSGLPAGLYLLSLRSGNGIEEISLVVE